jgi:MYXO-CTERM domain-containing protein
MRTQPLLQGLIVGASLVALWPSAAHARPEYPGALQEAADMVCVPTCLMCHTTSPGTITTFAQRPVGNLLLNYGLKPGEPDTMKGAWDNLVAHQNDATCAFGTVTCPTVVQLVPQGIEPMTKQIVCGPTYGCGATVAERPVITGDNDPMPAIGGALAAIAGLFAMRRRRR